jgi:O-acetyl-ADP-ribose deacetylase (regulator of RNase III)
VDGAIHRAAGPQLLEACKTVRQQQGECPPGHAVITLAGNLPAKAVIHAVGPVWHGGDQHKRVFWKRLTGTVCDWLPTTVIKRWRFRPSAPACMVTQGRCRNDRRRNRLPLFVAKTAAREGDFVCFDEDTTHLYQRLLTQRRQELES